MARGFKDEDRDHWTDVGEVKVVKETEQAVLVCVLESSVEVWIPKSVLISDPGSEGSEGPLTIKTWWHDQHWEGLMRTNAPPKAKVAANAAYGAIGVSQLNAVQKLLVGKGITVVRFEADRVVIDAKRLGAFSGKDLTEAVRALDVARRE